MWYIKLTIFLALFSSAVHAQSTTGDKILGEWVNEENDTKIEIYKFGANYSGKIIWDRVSEGKVTRKDVNNHDEKLRLRSLHNLEILSNFTYSDGNWESGKMYDPKSGKTYNCIIKIRADKLEIRGYVGIPLFGRTTYWERPL